MSVSAAASAEAQRLVEASYDGVLSTLSLEVAGYPFGSVVPFCLDQHGRPLILIASIAQHTKNIAADPRVSLLVFERNEPDLQAAGRVTVLADAARLAASERRFATRYFRYFPHATDYDLTHDFSFHALVPRRVRYIGGFGRIHWLHPAAVLHANPFDPSQEEGIVRHMNDDHADALVHYCLRAGIALQAGEAPVMAGCDGGGIHLRISHRIARIAFATPVADLGAMRKTLVAMARA
jgi:putative heme iron utilization protein